MSGGAVAGRSGMRRTGAGASADTGIRGAKIARSRATSL